MDADLGELGRRRRRGNGGAEFTPLGLYANGEQGLWYDPSDLTQEKVAWRRNLLLQSQDFENASWSKSGVTVTANSTTAPDGTTTADTIDSTAAGSWNLFQTVTLNGATATWSVYAKAGTSNFVQISSTGSLQYANFNVSNGTLGTVGGQATASITDVGNGWYRCTVTVIQAGAVGSLSSIYFTVIGSATASRIVGSTGSVFLWGAQMEYASSAGLYQRITDFNSDFLAAFPTHTLFQDSAGTQPVTVLGQSVGRILDKSGRGNHSTQATDASRPTLQARTNLLTYSEQFDNAAWATNAATITANQTTAPDGTSTADLLVSNTSNAIHLLSRSSTTIVSGLPYTYSVFMKKGTGATAPDWMQLTFDGATFGTTAYVNFNLNTGVVGATGTGATASIVSFDNGWYRCIITVTATASSTTSSGPQIVFTNNNDGLGRRPTYIDATTSDVFLWGAQLEQASAVGTYQRVVTATDYADIGAPRFLQFDGTDDSLATIANVDFTATDKMSVFSGVTKLSDAATGLVAELSAAIASNNGAFAMLAPSLAGANSYRYSSKGTIQTNAGTGVFAAAPNTSVLTGLSDIGGDVVTLRRNGSVVETSTADQGTGTYLSYPIYIGRSGGSTLPLNGRLFQLIVRGAATDSVTITNAEQYVAQKTGIAI